MDDVNSYVSFQWDSDLINTNKYVKNLYYGFLTFPPFKEETKEAFLEAINGLFADTDESYVLFLNKAGLSMVSEVGVRISCAKSPYHAFESYSITESELDFVEARRSMEETEVRILESVGILFKVSCFSSTLDNG